MQETTRKRTQRVRTRRARSRRQRQQNKAGMLCITCIVCFLLIAMSTQILKLYQKNEAYKRQERELASQLEDEQERQTDIENYEQYVSTQDYIEQIAKTKLGLVYPNEIIFKEKKEVP